MPMNSRFDRNTIERADYPASALVQHMGVDHRRGNIAMAQQLLHLHQQRGRLLPHQHRRQAGRLLRPHHVIEPRQLDFQNLLVEEQQGSQCLPLSGGADIAIARQMGQECLDLGLSHLVRVSLVMKQDEALDPAEIGRFGAQTVVLDADASANTIKPAGRL